MGGSSKRGTPDVVEVSTPPPLRPPEHGTMENIWGEVIPGLVGQPLPQFPGQAPGMSPTMEAAMRFGQGYGLSPAPGIMGDAASTLGGIMGGGMNNFNYTPSPGAQGALGGFLNPGMPSWASPPGGGPPNFLGPPSPGSPPGPSSPTAPPGGHSLAFRGAQEQPDTPYDGHYPYEPWMPDVQDPLPPVGDDPMRPGPPNQGPPPPPPGGDRPGFIPPPAGPSGPNFPNFDPDNPFGPMPDPLQPPPHTPWSPLTLPIQGGSPSGGKGPPGGGKGPPQQPGPPGGPGLGGGRQPVPPGMWP